MDNLNELTEEEIEGDAKKMTQMFFFIRPGSQNLTIDNRMFY